MCKFCKPCKPGLEKRGEEGVGAREGPRVPVGWLRVAVGCLSCLSESVAEKAKRRPKELGRSGQSWAVHLGSSGVIAAACLLSCLPDLRPRPRGPWTTCKFGVRSVSACGPVRRALAVAPKSSASCECTKNG